MAAEDEGDAYAALQRAVAEVGRCIEALPHHQRSDAITALLAPMTEGQRRDMMVGVFVVAHDMRLGLDEPWPTGADTGGE